MVDVNASSGTADAQPDLGALYAPPSDMILKGVLDHLLDFHQDYLDVATFFCLATCSDKGLDASPRGGPAGFVKVLDSRRVAFADWPGNNRIESLHNMERDNRVGMLFLFPGLEVFLRINGRAHISTDPDLLQRVSENKRLPKTAIVVDIDEVLFHCGKAANRAGLWDAAARIDRNTLPSIGKMYVAMAAVKDAQPEAVDAHYDDAVKNNLY